MNIYECKFLSCPSGRKSCYPINYLLSRAIGRMELFRNIAPIFERCWCSISAVGLVFPKPVFSIPLSGETFYSFYSVSISVDVNSCSVYIDKRIYIVYFRNTPFIDVNCSVSDLEPALHELEIDVTHGVYNEKLWPCVLICHSANMKIIDFINHAYGVFTCMNKDRQVSQNTLHIQRLR